MSWPCRPLLIALLIALPASGAIYLAPTDAEIIDAADAIVIATVTDMQGQFVTGGNIATVIQLDLLTVLKGDLDPALPFYIRELGGTVGSASMGVSAAPAYWRGNKALLFLQRTDDGHWRTWGAALGKFDFVTDRLGRKLIVRWAVEGDLELWSQDGHPVEEHLRDADQFLTYIRRRAGRSPGDRDRPRVNAGVPEPYVVPEITTRDVEPPALWSPGAQADGYPPSAYTYGTFRWDVFDKGGSVTFFVSGTQPGYDSIGTAQRGLAAWTNDTGSNVNYVYGGTRSNGFTSDGMNTIVYNSSSDVPSGALAYAQWYGGAYHTYKGEQFVSITEGDVVVRSGISISQKVFDEAVTHELGHTLGFRHSDQGTPSSTQAVMKAILSGAYGATLGPWDIDAVRTVYQSSTTATPPAAPSGLVATAISTTSIRITWNPSATATSYELERSANNGPFVRVATPTVTSHTDSGLSPSTTYLYRVRAINSAGASGYSNVDHATTILFLDDPLVAGVVVKDEHISQLQTAINAFRASAGLSAVSFPSVGPGVIIRASHISTLRSALSPALAARGISAIFTDAGPAIGTRIRAIHIQELRNYVK